MTDDSAQQRFRRLEELKTEIATAAGLQPDNQTVLLVAGLRLTHESLLAEMIATGKPPDPGAMTSLTKAIAEHTPPPIQDEQVTMNVSFFEGVGGPPAVDAEGKPLVVAWGKKRNALSPEYFEKHAPGSMARVRAVAEYAAAEEAARAHPAEDGAPAPAVSPPEPPRKLTAAERSEQFHSGGLLKKGEQPGGGGIPGVAGVSIGDLMGGMSNHSRTYANGLTRDPHPFRRGGGYA